MIRLLNFAPAYDEPGNIATKRLLLRRPHSSDYQAWAELRSRSEAFLRPYEPLWSSNELSKPAWRSRLRRQEGEINSGRSLPWFLFDIETGDLLGGLTISNIRRGVANAGSLGYWMGEPHAGKGFMGEAVRAVCKEVFECHGLHRVEAATLTDNQRSIALLKRSGFQQEGYARGYLKICGQWRDHILFARLASDPSPTD